jgi:hypothetical protein
VVPQFEIGPKMPVGLSDHVWSLEEIIIMAGI